MKNYLHILGPYDRYNYGDLLFPYMIEQEIGGYYDSIFIYSTSNSDLSSVGGMKTVAFQSVTAFSSDVNNTVVVAGGESLGTDWGTLCYYVDPTFKIPNYLLYVLGKFIRQADVFRLKNYIGRYWFKGRTYLPLCIGKDEIQNIDKLYYNSLGGTNIKSATLKSVKTMADVFRSVDYLAVRDTKTEKLLSDSSIRSSLCPDSAILMSKFFSVENLEKKCSKSVLSFIDKNKGNYLFVQANNFIGSENIEEVASQLNKIQAAGGLKICLCPIGIAIGHEDHIFNEKVSKMLTGDYTVFPPDISIWETMLLISQSQLYIGTSLHGVITAMSYTVPYVGLSVKKLDFYLATWAVKELNHVKSYDEICTAGIDAMKVSKEEMETNLVWQRRIAEESFEKMKP